MLTFHTRNVAAFVIFACMLTACSREQQDWRAAEAADSIDGYGQFMERHPDSELVTQARTRVAQLQEDLEWQRVGGIDTPDAYRQFLAQHPSGKWSQEARIRLQNFALRAAPAAPAGAAAVTQATPPDVAAGVAPVAPPANTTGYAIQLGAFVSEAAANSQWQQLVARFGPDLQGLTPRVLAVTTADGPLFRLQAEVRDELEARARCESLRKRSQPCVPVLPH